MTKFSEDRLDLVVEPQYLKHGEHVSVVTRLGREVGRGYVAMVYTEGVHIQDNPVGSESGGEKLWAADIYRFIPVDDLRWIAHDVSNGAEKPAPEDEPPDEKEPETQGQPGTGQVDVDSLPKDVKSKIKAPEDLTDDQVNRVLVEIGEAALRSLRKVKVNEQFIYGLVDSISKSVVDILKKGTKGERV